MSDMKSKFTKATAENPHTHILVAEQDEGVRRVDVKDLTVSLPGDKGIVLVEDVNLTLNAGDRVVMTGASGSGKTTVAKALLNQWDYGEGMIVMPADVKIMAMSQTPHFPNGDLRTIMNMKPEGEYAYDDADLTKALQIVGHDRLVQHIPGQQFEITMNDFFARVEDALFGFAEKDLNDGAYDQLKEFLDVAARDLVHQQYEIVQFIPEAQREMFKARMKEAMSDVNRHHADDMAEALLNTFDEELARPLAAELAKSLPEIAERYSPMLGKLTSAKVDYLAARLASTLKGNLKDYLVNKDTDDKARPIRLNQVQADYVVEHLKGSFKKRMQAHVSDGVLSQVFNAVTWPTGLVNLARKASRIGTELTQRLTFHMDKQVWTGNDFKSRLSGGERQKLTMAIAFLHNPDVLILDEITAALDEQTGIELYGELMQRLPEETIVVSIAHNKHIMKFHTHHAHLEDKGITMTPIKQDGPSAAPTPKP